MNQKEVAEAFGVTARTIRNWDAAGMPSVGDGRERKYHLPDCVAWRVEAVTASALAGASREVPPKAESEARLLLARASLVELDLLERRHELLPAEVVEEVWAKVLDGLRSRILNLPGRWAPTLVGLENPREGMAALKPLVRELLEDISDRLPQELEVQDDA